MSDRTPYSQLARYHREALLEQIAELHQQIEQNLANKQNIRHLKDLIAEREQYLNQIDEAPRAPGAGSGAKNTPGTRRGLPRGANPPGGYRG